ncbi:hypothetical protein QVD17_26174 [Tagetes erecta]|uniref:Uncharacterized protein n=1 Tax=Tagetes erecta TaxID=13708 RepID=A0AAD8K6D7_TARER|nr:hypothetical protein QVD17_26174 [Tagetes erecta]
MLSVLIINTFNIHKKWTKKFLNIILFGTLYLTFKRVKKPVEAAFEIRTSEFDCILCSELVRYFFGCCFRCLGFLQVDTAKACFSLDGDSFNISIHISFCH